MVPSGNKREDILNATFELVQNFGLNELTTAKIARASGTAETIIYRHFSNKHAIMTELLQRTCLDFQKAAAFVVAEPISPFEKIEKLTALHLEFIQRTHGMSRILFSEQVHLAAASDPLKQIARTLAIESRHCVKQIIEEGIRCSLYNKNLDIETASMSFMGVFYLLIHEWALDDFSWNITDKKAQIVEHFHQSWACKNKPID